MSGSTGTGPAGHGDLVGDQCAIAHRRADRRRLGNALPGLGTGRRWSAWSSPTRCERTGAVREFTDEPVDDDVLARVLDTARFAPSGGNAQSWRVVVVQGRRASRPAPRPVPARLVRLPGDDAVRPAAWSPVNDRAAEQSALTAVPDRGRRVAAEAGLRRAPRPAPVLLALFAESGGAGRRRPRLRPVLARRRGVGLPVRVEHPAGGTRGGPRRRHHHDGDPRGGRREGAAGRCRPQLALAGGHRAGSSRCTSRAGCAAAQWRPSPPSTASTAHRSAPDQPN